MNHEMEKQPMALARREDLVVQEMPGEVLVYDLRQHKAHCLNKTAAFIWDHCDGQKTVADLTTLMIKEFKTPVDENIIWHTLERLGKADLLAEKMIRPSSATFRSRRALLGKLGTTALLSIPVVMSITSPAAAAAASVPPVCTTCRKKSDGACPTDCGPTVLGTCYDNAGCGSGQAINCVSCQACFDAFPPSATISWEAPGTLC